MVTANNNGTAKQSEANHQDKMKQKLQDYKEGKEEARQAEKMKEKSDKTETRSQLASEAKKRHSPNDNTVSLEKGNMSAKDGTKITSIVSGKNKIHGAPPGIEYHLVEVDKKGRKPVVGSGIVTKKASRSAALAKTKLKGTKDDGVITRSMRLEKLVEEQRRQAEAKQENNEEAMRQLDNDTHWPPMNGSPTKNTDNASTDANSNKDESTDKGDTPTSGNHDQGNNENEQSNNDKDNNDTQTPTRKNNNNQKESSAQDNEEKPTQDTGGQKDTSPQPNAWRDKNQTSTTTQTFIPIKMNGIERVVEIIVDLEGVNEEPTQADQVVHMRKALTWILNRGREVAGTKNFGIQPFFPSKEKKLNIGMLTSSKEIEALTFEQCRNYLAHEDQKPGMANRYFKTGKNSRWKIRFVVLGAHWDQFMFVYNRSKLNQAIQSQFIPFYEASGQGEYSFALGSFLNTSKRQLMDRIENEIAMQFGSNVYFKHTTMPGGFEAQNYFWGIAKKKGDGNTPMTYHWAPQAQVLFTDETDKLKRIQLVTALNEAYGKQDNNEEYPKMIDGTRARFLPAQEYLSLMAADKSKALMAVQIELNKQALEMTIPIKDVDTEVPNMENKTVGELILQMYDTDEQEMIFRHFVRGWSSDWHKRDIKVSVLQKMGNKAREVIRNLRDVLESVYNADVAEFIMGEKSSAPATERSNYGLDIEVPDRYLNGKNKFVIEGLEQLLKPKEKVTKTMTQEYNISIYEDITVGTKKSDDGRVEVQDDMTCDDATIETKTDLPPEPTKETPTKPTATPPPEPPIRTPKKTESSPDESKEQDQSENTSTESEKKENQQEDGENDESNGKQDDDDDDRGDFADDYEETDMFYDKWGSDIKGELQRFNVRSGRKAATRIEENKPRGIDLGISFFKMKERFPDSMDETARVIKEAFIGKTESEDEEIVRIMQITGKLSMEARALAKERGWIESSPYVSGNIPRRMYLPKGIDPNHLTRASMDEIYAYHASRLWKVIQREHAGATNPAGDQ